jgi:outer membrane lipoprotein
MWHRSRAATGVALALSMAALWGCTHVISSEIRATAREDLSFPMVLADPERYHGETVIWGGVILETLNKPDGTTLVILETPLDWEGAPRDEEFSRGRFMARTESFLDEAVYRHGRKVTLAGQVAGREVQPVGEVPYGYPVLSIREIHLWRETVGAWVPAYPWGPYWYWGGPYWHWEWWWPGWGMRWRRR